MTALIDSTILGSQTFDLVLIGVWRVRRRCGVNWVYLIKLWLELQIIHALCFNDREQSCVSRLKLQNTIVLFFINTFSGWIHEFYAPKMYGKINKQAFYFVEEFSVSKWLSHANPRQYIFLYVKVFVLFRIFIITICVATKSKYINFHTPYSTCSCYVKQFELQR